MQQYLWIYLKGMAMGAADVVPGVSGGTIAFITGIYERLLRAIKSFDIHALRLLLGLKFNAFLQHTDFKFLLALGLGIATSILSLAHLFSYLLEHHTIYTMSFFFGLILATVFVVGQKITNWNIWTSFVFFLGVVVAVSIAFLSPANENASIIYLFLCGIIAICSMILPGVSGSFVLLIMGNYFLIIRTLKNSMLFLKEGNISELIAGALIIAPFGVGAIVGLLSFSRVVSWLFEKYEQLTLAVLTGFILGSLAIIYPWKSPIKQTQIIAGKAKTKTIDYTYYLPEINTDFFIACVIILVGAALVISIEKVGNKKQHLERTH